jgi:PAS domain S-box-containing protein
MPNCNHDRRRVLVIDDNPAVHEDFRKILARAGGPDRLAEVEARLFDAVPGARAPAAAFEIDAVCRGEEGVQQVRQARLLGRPYAVVFVDIRMPAGWNGIETLARVWREDPDIQAVVCTAHSDYSWNEMLTRLGQTDRLLVLKKPFDHIEVQQLTWALTEKWSLARQARLVAEESARLVAQRTAALSQVNEELRREVAQRRGVESALRDSEEHVRQARGETEQLLAAISSILIEVDPQDHITRWNTVAEATFGVAAAEVLGRPLGAGVAGLDGAALADRLARSRAQGEPQRLDDLPFAHADGRPGFLELTINPANDGAPRMGHLVIVGRDVTERKGLERQLAQARKLASLGQLAAGIAHEINTPTQFVGDNIRFLQDAFVDLKAALEKYAALLEAGRGAQITPALLCEVEQALDALELDYLTEEIPKAIQQSLEGQERLAKIALAMQEFSHPGNGERRAIDLNKALDSTLTVAHGEWRCVADVVMDCDPNLPLVPCLADDINQALLNVVVNAAHAIADVVGDGSRGKGVITIGTRRDGDWAEIRVRDTGTGIPENAQARVFEPFFTTKAVGRGTGQGLAIAHDAIVKKHGGTIAFETAMGRGTTFIIRLPLAAQVVTERSAQ